MITRATLIWMVLAVGAGFGLFQVSYRVASLEEELNNANRQIVEERERLHALQAEWSFLSSPNRLAEISRRHLPLQPLATEQMIRIEDLPLRLPPLMAEGEDFKQAAPVGGVAVLAPEAPAPKIEAPAAAPATVAATPAPVTTATPEPAKESDDPIGDLVKKVSAAQ